jgi:hypothetical protein
LLLAALPIQVLSQSDPGIEKFNDPNMLVEEAAACLELIQKRRNCHREQAQQTPMRR